MKENPLILEISARLLIQEIESRIQSKGDLSHAPDELLAGWRESGFDAVWIMGVWTTGEAGRRVSLVLSDRYSDVLPGWKAEDVVGSPYAVREYTVHPEFGGEQALAVLRARMATYDLSLILDFVPNHTARDHQWVSESPHWYVQGSEELLASQPQNYCRLGDYIIAHGRDPYFDGWADTFQLDYRRSETRQAMIGVLHSIAGRCDAVRCDMSILVLSDIFHRTWGPLDGAEFGEKEFWAEAIDRVRADFPAFKMIAEAYWDLEERLQLLGFDYTYHKSFYDHLRHGETAQARASLTSPDYVKRSVFFIENHDEPRAAFAFPDEGRRRAAAFISLALPGMRLVHYGQSEGRAVQHSVHLGRRKQEEINTTEQSYYRHVLQVMKTSCIGRGEWKLLEIHSAGQGNSGAEHLVACLWEDRLGIPLRNLVVVNLSADCSEGFITVTFFEVGGRPWVLDDLLSDQVYHRRGTDMAGLPGLYVKLEPYEAQIFDIKPA